MAPKIKFKSKLFAGTEDGPQVKVPKAEKPTKKAKVPKSTPIVDDNEAYRTQKEMRIEKALAKRVEAQLTPEMKKVEAQKDKNRPGTKANPLKVTPKGTKPVKAPKAKEDIEATVANIPASTVTIKSNVAPSVEIATELQQAFDHFNRTLYAGKLEPVVFSNCRLKKAKGYFWAKQWARRKEMKGKVHEIGLDFAKLHGENDKQVLSTLVHEMAHLQIEQIGKAPKKPFHCKYWVAAMKQVGLTPIIIDSKGNISSKPTGPNATHEIDKGGPFDKACDELLKSGFKLSWASEAVIEPEKPKAKKRAGGKFKYEADCGAAFWGKPNIAANCQCGCGSEFVQLDKEDADGSEEGTSTD